MLELLNFVWLSHSLEDAQLLISMCAFCPKFVGVENSFCSISIELEALRSHGLIFPIDYDSLPSQDWVCEFIRSPPVDNSIIVRLFDMSNRSKLSSSLPIILWQVSLSDAIERQSKFIVQLHDRWVTVELFSLVTSMEDIVVQAVWERYRHLLN